MARKVSTGRPRRLQSRVQRALEPPQGVSLRVCGIREGFSSSPVAICTVCTLRDLPAKACDAKTAHRTGTGSSGSDQARMRTPQNVSLRVLGGQELFSQDHGSGQRGGSGAGRGVGLFNDRHHGDVRHIGSVPFWYLSGFCRSGPSPCGRPPYLCVALPWCKDAHGVGSPVG